MSRSRYLPAAIVGALMLVFGLWGIGTASLSITEAATRWSAHLSPSQLGHLVRHVDAVHGVYYACMHVWIAAFGNSTLVLRLPSAIGMAIAAALTTYVGARLTGSQRVGIVAGVLFMALPFVDDYAQIARSYALVTMIVMATTLAFLRALESPTWGRWAVYGSFVLAAGWLHEFTLLTLPAHALILILSGTSASVIRRWVITTAAAVVGTAPLIYLSTRESGAVSWIHPTRLADFPPLFHDFFGGTTAVAVIAGLCALVGSVPSGRHRGMSVRTVAVPLTLLPAATLLIESAILTPLYDQRYVIYSVPFATILTATGVERIASWLGSSVPVRSARTATLWAVPAAVCLIAVVLQFSGQVHLRGRAHEQEALNSAAIFVRRHAHFGDGVVFITNNYRNTALGYPGDFVGLDDFSLRQSPLQSGTFRGLPKKHFEIRLAELRQRRIWVVGVIPQRCTGVAAVEVGVLRTEFRDVLHEHYKGVDVALYKRLPLDREDLA